MRETSLDRWSDSQTGGTMCARDSSFNLLGASPRGVRERRGGGGEGGGRTRWDAVWRRDLPGTSSISNLLENLTVTRLKRDRERFGSAAEGKLTRRRYSPSCLRSRSPATETRRREKPAASRQIASVPRPPRRRAASCRAGEWRPSCCPRAGIFLFDFSLTGGPLRRDFSTRVTVAVVALTRRRSHVPAWTARVRNFPGTRRHVKMNVNTHRAVQSVWFTMAFLWAVEWRRCHLADSPDRRGARTRAWVIEIDGKKSDSIFRGYLFARRNAATSAKRTFLLSIDADSRQTAQETRARHLPSARHATASAYARDGAEIVQLRENAVHVKHCRFPALVLWR